MGAGGDGIFDDDVALDVRGTLEDALATGSSPEEAGRSSDRGVRRRDGRRGGRPGHPLRRGGSSNGTRARGGTRPSPGVDGGRGGRSPRPMGRGGGGGPGGGGARGAGALA